MTKQRSTDLFSLAATALAAWALLLAALPASAADYKAVPGCEVEFTAKITGSSFVATSTALGGTLSYDAATGTLEKATLIVKADSFATGMDMRDSHMKEKYLEAEKFPEIRLEVPKQPLAAAVGKTVPIKGEFVIKGIRRPVTLQVKLEKLDAGSLVASCEFPLDITAYGIPQPKFAVVKMDTVIAATVKLVLAAVK